MLLKLSPVGIWQQGGVGAPFFQLLPVSLAHIGGVTLPITSGEFPGSLHILDERDIRMVLRDCFAGALGTLQRAGVNPHQLSVARLCVAELTSA